jgi:hypothetical protein
MNKDFDVGAIPVCSLSRDYIIDGIMDCYRSFYIYHITKHFIPAKNHGDQSADRM